MNEKLSGEYLADFNEVTKYLKKYAAKGEKLNEVLDDLSELYSDLEAEGAPVSSVHEGSAEDYAKELLENLPRKKKLSSKAITAIVAVVVFIISAVYFTTDSKMAIPYVIVVYLKNSTEVTEGNTANRMPMIPARTGL